jgi:DNA-binding beta-propeller fold protein YncE
MLAMAMLLLQVAQTPPPAQPSRTVQIPQRSVADPGIITTNQQITPAGIQSVFDGRVTGVHFGATAGELWVGVPGNAYQIMWSDNHIMKKVPLGGRTGIYGVAYDPVTRRAFVSGVGRVPPGAPRPAGIGANTSNVAQLFAFASDTAARVPVWFGMIGRDMAGGPAIARRANAAGHRVVVVPLPAQNQIAILDADSARLLTTVALGVIPVAAAVTSDGATAWVTEMAGAKPSAGDRTGKQCCESRAEAVRVDARGIALPGTVSEIDVVRGVVTRTITVGRHPTALAFDEPHARLFVADGNDDDVTIIDTQTGRIVNTIHITPFTERATGLAPTAVALSTDGRRLFIALGGINAVAIYDVGNPARATLLGLIPTGWYPTTLDVSGDGKYIAAGTLLGVGSGTGTTEGKTARYVHAVRGSVNVIEIPDNARLGAYSIAVAENNRLHLADVNASRASNPARAGAAGAAGATGATGATGAAGARRDVRPRAVPARPGDPSTIEHVVYIIRENRTFDQVLGDLDRGDRDSSLVMYGRDITPNTHALSQHYVTFDRMFASGGNSADGHQWLTQANETEYTLWPLYNGRSYPYDGSDPLAYSSGGFIWEAAASRNRSVAVLGEFAPERPDSGAPMRARLMDEYVARKAGTGNAPFPVYHASSDIPSLDRVLVRGFPTWTLAVPDVVRAEMLLGYLADWESKKTMPNLVIMQLPGNHTAGTSSGWCTPKACVADNDLALGQIVEGLSHSLFWKSMAIIVIEDDAQNGVDHVDGHRTVALTISPYARRGVVDSTFYNSPSILKTIELMLGLPTLSMFDLVATDMGNAFIGPDEQPDLTPYTALQPAQSIFERNVRVGMLRGAQRDAAVASARMRFDIPDAAPTEKLNRILWMDAKGWKTPYPTVRQSLFMPLSSDVADEDREEAAERAARARKKR